MSLQQRNSGASGQYEISSCPQLPQESYERILVHLREILPETTDKQLNKLIK